jgi:hypothetical protein
MDGYTLSVIGGLSFSTRVFRTYLLMSGASVRDLTGSKYTDRACCTPDTLLPRTQR